MLPGREAPARAGPPDLHRLAQGGAAGVPVSGHERHEQPGLASVQLLRSPAVLSGQVRVMGRGRAALGNLTRYCRGVPPRGAPRQPRRASGEQPQQVVDRATLFQQAVRSAA
jgi:hypothetical protein